MLNLKPDNSALYIKLSTLRLSLGEVSEALGSVKECLRLDPDQKQCKAKFKELRKLDKSLTGLESAVKMSMWTNVKLSLFGRDGGVLEKVESLGSKVLMGRVYQYACQSLFNVLLVLFVQCDAY